MMNYAEFEGKSTFCLPDPAGRPSFIEMPVDEQFVDAAPEGLKGVANRALLAAEFLKTFDLVGRFMLASTKGIIDDSDNPPDMRVTCCHVFDARVPARYKEALRSLPPGLAMVIYTGLTYLTSMPLQLEQRDAVVTDSTSIVSGVVPDSWVVLRFLWNKSKHDITSNIFVYERKKPFSFVASYAVMEGEFYDAQGKPLAVEPGITNKFKEVFGEEELERMVRECLDGTEGDKHSPGRDPGSADTD